MHRKLSRFNIALVLVVLLLTGCMSSSPGPDRADDEWIQSLVQQTLAGELDPGTIVARVSRGQVVQIWWVDYDGKLAPVPADDRERTLARAESYLKPHRDCFKDTSYCQVVILEVQTPAQATVMRCKGGGDIHPASCDELRLAQVGSQWQVLSKERTTSRGPCQCQALWPMPTPSR